MLTRCGELDEFAKSCFGHFLSFDANAIFSSHLVHNLLTREITFEGAGQNEIWFGIGQRRMRFSKYEFCLVTGLKFGGPSNIPSFNSIPVRGGVYQRYWPTMDVNVTRLNQRFIEPGAVFQKPLDAFKIALVLFVETFLFGSDYRKKVSSWLFSLVEELEQFNRFPWGKHVYQRTFQYLYKGIRSPQPGTDSVRWHLYGFPIALQVVF